MQEKEPKEYQLTFKEKHDLRSRYVSGIDLNLFNRWGDPIFKATSPLFTWEGIHQESQLPLPSGIYYYTCIVETLRLQGIVNQKLNGFTHLIRDFNNQD